MKSHEVLKRAVDKVGTKRAAADIDVSTSLVYKWCEQAKKHPERRPLLAKHLERAEPRCRYLLDVIGTTGQTLLDELIEDEDEAATA